MDALSCAGLAFVEASLLIRVRPDDKPLLPTIITTAFLVHYLLVKSYRIWLYPRYFSPLRHVPGPQVSCPPLEHYTE